MAATAIAALLASATPALADTFNSSSVTIRTNNTATVTTTNVSVANTGLNLAGGSTGGDGGNGGKVSSGNGNNNNGGANAGNGGKGGKGSAGGSVQTGNAHTRTTNVNIIGTTLIRI